MMVFTHSSIFTVLYSQTYTPEQIDNALIIKSEKLRIRGQKKELISLNQNYIVISRNQNYLKGEILGYINIANICATIGDYKHSFCYLQKAEEKIKKINNAYLSARLYQEYGQLNYVIGLYVKALKYNSQSIYYGRMLSKQYEKEVLSAVYANRADFLHDIHQNDSSLIYLHKALKIKSSPVINSLIADHYMVYKKDTDSSSYYLNNALKLLRKMNYWNIQRGQTYYYYGNLFCKKNNYAKALVYYGKSVSILEKTKRVYNIPQLYKTIANTYRILNDEEKEKEYLNKYTKLKDSLNRICNESINISVGETLKEKESENISKNNIFFIYNIVVVCLIVILCIAYILYQKNKIIISQKEFEASVLKEKLNNSCDYIIELAKKNDPNFLNKFQEIYPCFIKKLLTINSNLSKSDLSFCTMIWLGFSSKEIAQYTFVEHRSVQNKKHRLRKKMNISSDIDLYFFFKNLSDN
ncbi:LuxR C-terminal-related transcriptional regulator [Chryseobacterium sp. ES2]|uniref:LuxR C-terminal-related transcriptional regulator n=1 Tax=Chryseobacterium metallicongregator TaxID=3073042 RepID=A0ABU1DZD6_9FLAO|nr:MULTISPECIES: LuxR C-terminal-related transcriptional regulator [Chryseobacterium]MDR4950907.1 LuxR C-terminal-related transcriptional regulator [Chryseobacterium sp. ES2]